MLASNTRYSDDEVKYSKKISVKTTVRKLNGFVSVGGSSTTPSALPYDLNNTISFIVTSLQISTLEHFG